MRSWGFEPTPEDLAPLRAAQDAFRAKWIAIRPPWPAPFDGSIADVEAIDYLQYEGLDFPKCGEEGAALVCGEAFRQAAGLVWVIDYRGEWFVTSNEADWPRVAVCPLNRLKELEYARTPQYGRYMLFIARAALDCLPYVESEATTRLRELASRNENLEAVRAAVRHVEPPHGSA